MKNTHPSTQVRSLMLWPDPLLSKPTTQWNFSDPPMDYQQLEKELTDTLQHHGAVGLAANQIGYDFRVFAQHCHSDDLVRILYNPEILYLDSEQQSGPEGCLSFPKTKLSIPRPKTLTARWQNHRGEVRSQDFTDIDARCFLHELDHLNGVTFNSLVSDLRFRRAYGKL